MARLDQLLLAGLGLAADRLGHGELWNAGASKVARVAVKVSGVPSDEMTVDEIGRQLGVTPDHVELVDGLMGVVGKLRSK